MTGALPAGMRLVAVGLFIVLAAVPAAAQPADKQPPPPPAGSDAATFDSEVAAMIAQPGGLTADAAAERAAKTSPEVRHKLAEVAAATAQTKQIELARVPQVSATARYTRLSDVTLPMLAPGF